MANQKQSAPPENKSISISGDVVDSTVISGDNNTVNQTIIQKFFNIFKSDSETLEQRNRRILLGHVENAWIKGVLDASLHGAALLDLGIKQDPEAVTKYPWAIKKESTDETLPAGTSMLEIFDSIGMGRSLLILGAPGSGKTTMLLELARQLIQHAREDITYPIPMVFNLASWTEKLSLADWLAQELNNLYSVPRKTAPDWVKGNKLLLLLDGLDEVRRESRAKCVEAINAFRKEHGMTSLAVCSRSQDYADLNANLSFEGAIEVQPLTQEQIYKFFNRFGKGMAGIKRALKEDSTLREMAETPLFLSIMLMTYRDKQDIDILASEDKNMQRRYLLGAYVERMFERPRSKNVSFKKQDVLHWLSWLAQKMIQYSQSPFLFENMQPMWLSKKKQINYRQIIGLILLVPSLISVLNDKSLLGLVLRFGVAPFVWIAFSLGWLGSKNGLIDIEMIDTITWNWKKGGKNLIIGLIIALIVAPLVTLIFHQTSSLSTGLLIGLFLWLGGVLQPKSMSETTYPGQRLSSSTRNSFFTFFLFGLMFGITALMFRQISALNIGLGFGLMGGLFLGGLALLQHYALRFILARNNLLPWRLIPFLDHCVELIFLRRVGGGYIFVHRLLMEHFAEMYVETPTSKGN
jgi:DNA polymerase III delta prime subunit